MESLTAFYIKKFISFFLEPFGLSLLLVTLSILLLHRKRTKAAVTLLYATLAVLLVFSYPLVSDALLRPVERAVSTEKGIPPKIEYIHILGSGANEAKWQPLSSRLGESALKRVLEGYIQYREHPGSHIVVTGFRRPDRNESYTDVAVSLLEKMGVPRKDIVFTDRTKDTEEEAKFIKRLVGDEPYILVTSASHMRRALYVMRKYSLASIAVPTDYGEIGSIDLLYAPSLEALKRSQMALHEYLGMLWYKLKDFAGLFEKGHKKED